MGEFVPLYRAAALLGFSPRQLDDLELWEVAAVLGMDDPEQSAGEPDLIAERVRAAREGRTLTAEDLPRSRIDPRVGSLGLVRGGRGA